MFLIKIHKKIFTQLKNFIKYFLLGLLTVITIIPKYFIIGLKFFFSEKDQKKLNMEDKIIPIVIITLSLTTYLLCIFLLSRWFVQTERNKKFSDSLNHSTELISEIEQNITDYQENNTPKENNNNKKTTKYFDNLDFINIDLEKYIKINSETVAWIQVNGTNINYPVVQHQDNQYYLEHSFYKKKSSAGAIFADYRDNFKQFNNNTIIYGHNMINGTMFSKLTYTQQNWWQKNPNYHYIKLSTKDTNSIWQVFSTYKTKPTTDYLQSKFYSTENYQAFLNTIKNKSSYDFNTNININDKVLTLSTCDNTGTKRIVVHAKLMQIEEK